MKSFKQLMVEAKDKSFQQLSDIASMLADKFKYPDKTVKLVLFRLSSADTLDKKVITDALSKEKIDKKDIVAIIKKVV